MGAAIEVRAPAEQSEGTRSQVQRWLKAPGDAVREQDPLLELETDKVTVEIAAPASGTLLQIVTPEGTEVAPGDLLAMIATGAEAGAGSAATGAGAAAGIEARAGAGAAAVAAATATSSAAAAAARPRGLAPGAPTLPAASVSPAALSPAVRRLLAERGLRATDVTGTGAGGRITVDDVLGARAAGEPAAEARGVSEPAATLQPHSAVRRRIAAHMVESLRAAPHVTTVFEADMTAVLAHRAKHKAEFEARGASLTLTAYFLAACAPAIRAVPEANSRWHEQGLALHEAMHIGVATALDERGLVVPVVRDVQALDLFGIARELGGLVARARDDRLTPADMRGGTFTISNHGVSGSLVATPIVINQGQSAILGVGKLEKRPVVVSEQGEDRVVVRPRCYVTLTIDHRVMDGHRANRFLEVLVRQLEQVSNR